MGLSNINILTWHRLSSFFSSSLSLTWKSLELGWSNSRGRGDVPGFLKSVAAAGLGFSGLSEKAHAPPTWESAEEKENMWSREEIRQFLQLLPVGFGFHPSDEQLVSHYLFTKIQGRNSQLKMEAPESQMRMEMEMEMIPEVDLCRCEPPELAALLNHPVFSALQSSSNDPEWYFFSTPQKKYPNGRRLKRATAQGFWKPTGPDRKITCRTTGIDIGTKKTLVFHTGRGPSAPRTPWIIHEYHSSIPSLSEKENNSYVLCRLKKDVGPGCPLETNFNRASPPPPPDLTSVQTPSTITKEVGSSSTTTSPGIHQSDHPPTTETVGSTNFAAPNTKDDDKHDDITSDVKNKGKDPIIPEEPDVLCDDDHKEDSVGSDFPAETNINRMSPEPPSVHEPSPTTMEIDVSSGGVGIRHAAALVDNMNLGDCDMIDQQDSIDWDAINHNGDGSISQKTDVLCCVKRDAGSDFPVETNHNGMSPILPSIQAPVLPSMEIDHSTPTGDGVHQTAGPADNLNLDANDLIYPRNGIDWDAVNYFEDDVIPQEFDLAAFDLGYGYIYDVLYP